MEGTVGMKTYRINEIFYSVQGEGRRAGEPSTFVRFSGCNLTCKKATHGFDCDTEWMSGKTMTADEIVEAVRAICGHCDAIILTGGEPLLQLDKHLIDALRFNEHYLCVETNGTQAIPEGIDYVAMSPKVAEHAVVPTMVDELRYVRRVGQGIPKPKCESRWKYISPAAEGDAIDRDNLDYCIQLVKDNPEWFLSVQQHKLWGVR